MLIFAFTEMACSSGCRGFGNSNDNKYVLDAAVQKKNVMRTQTLNILNKECLHDNVNFNFYLAFV